jgi:hypothetical protein
MRLLLTPFNIIAALILGLALAAYWYVNLPGQYQNRLPAKLARSRRCASACFLPPAASMAF